MFADYHMHTAFSDDSTFPMEDVILRALEVGLDEICFTEHVDYGIPSIANCDYEAYLDLFNRLKMKYQSRISLKLGIEFGVQTETISKYKADFDRLPLDFVILSVHQVHNLELHNQMYQKGKTQKEYQEGYYQEILDVIRNYKDYSVLGHLDVINRYDLQGDYPFEALRPIITDILKTVIKDGKGIEVNTSSFRYKLKDLTPSLDILKLYKSLGGEIITIGSDSHVASHVGYKILDIQATLKELGFDSIYTFDKMKPIAHAL